MKEEKDYTQNDYESKVNGQNKQS
jgi:chromosome segregation ATPase